MIVYDKVAIKESITIEDVYSLLNEWGGEPEYSNFGILSATICHNQPGEGSRKLYFYSNSMLFKCYTGCAESFFDIFEMVIKIASIQWNQDYDLNDAVRWIAQRFGISGEYQKNSDEEELADWKILANYERIQDIDFKTNNVILKEYDESILTRFNYNLKIEPWLKENISQEVMDHAQIGFYPGGDQITIPHFDQNSRFIGLRGRALCQEDAERYGKYRPLKINNILYNHPLGMNLYNLNNSQFGIYQMEKAIIFESEKSSLLYQSYFGIDNDISVACCGSSITQTQIQLLINAGAKEIVIALDRQFKEIGDDEFKKLKNNLMKIRNRYKNEVLVSFIFDKKKITGYKASPIDEGAEKFLTLFKERIVL